MDSQARDALLNSLQWSGEDWQGRIQFRGVDIPFLLECDSYELTDVERRLAINALEDALQHVTEDWEHEARLQAATEIIASVSSQAEDSPGSEAARRIASEMQLESVDFVYNVDEETTFPALAYRCPKSFPDMTLCIQFTAGFVIDEVTLNERQ